MGLEFPKLGVHYFGVLIIRIPLFRVISKLGFLKTLFFLKKKTYFRKLPNRVSGDRAEDSLSP